METLDDAVVRMHKDVEEFAKHYRSMQAVEPDNWPSEMNAADWDEQFMSAAFQ